MATKARSTLNIFVLLKNIFFPKFCFGCNKFGTYLCKSCKKSLRFVNVEICVYCQKMCMNGLTHISCKQPFGLDGSLSLFRYAGITQNIIKKIKYGLIYDAAEDIYNAIPNHLLQKISFIKSVSPHITIIPVPLHKKRKRDRGFNQAEKLFERIAYELQIPITANVVSRKKNTIPQVKMVSKTEREKNIIDAFSVNLDVCERDFIICDDVWTTGTTIKEVCRELKKRGARNIYALTIARVYL